MDLTGKCLSDFGQFLYDNYPNNLISENFGYSYGMFERDLEQLTYILPEQMTNAIIIDFFDSVGLNIMINKERLSSEWMFVIHHHTLSSGLKNRNEATKFSIIKANEIYNKL
jgi:hypothetical protein